MDRIAINEHSFQQAMKQRVFLERIFSYKSYEQNRNFRDSCLKNLEFFFVGMRILSGRQRSKRFFWKECLNSRSYEKNCNFRIH